VCRKPKIGSDLVFENPICPEICQTVFRQKLHAIKLKVTKIKFTCIPCAD